MSIGDLARASGLTVKRLRHYHDTGVLVADWTDPASGYRWYQPDQVNDAVLVRRLRDSEIPLEQVGEILRSGQGREELVLAALTRVREELDQARARLDEAADLLREPPPVAVAVRLIPELPVVTASAELSHAECPAWFGRTFPQLYAAAGGLGAGPPGACYGAAFFEQDRGPVLAFVPVAAERASAVLPAGAYAVAMHDGSYDHFSLTYAALGAAVHRAYTPRAGADVREHYLIGPSETPEPHRWRSEVCWPIEPLPPA
ncbi:MerR family transcriptional regulator [Enemella dayhoffiae]|nr:MerR family transcriptional regulator [Enemella dayhoffiae]